MKVIGDSPDRQVRAGFDRDPQDGTFRVRIDVTYLRPAPDQSHKVVNTTIYLTSGELKVLARKWGDVIGGATGPRGPHPKLAHDPLDKSRR